MVEGPVSPVFNFIKNRSDVNLSKIAVVSLSYCGSTAPIAASHDNRYSAVTAIDGLPSTRRAIEDQLPAEIVSVFNTSSTTRSNDIMTAIQANFSYSTELRWLIDQSLLAFQTHDALNGSLSWAILRSRRKWWPIRPF